MATPAGIVSMAAILKVAYSSYKESPELLGLLESTLSNYSDAEIVAAAKRCIETMSNAPRVADIRSAANDLRTERGLKQYAEDHAGPQYIDYHDRPKWERDEIDVAKLEFHRVWTALENGAKIEDLFPYNSEPCKLARQIRERDANEAEEQRKRVN
jgi:hypothetical protein